MRSSEHGSALPPTTRNVVMRRSLPVFALMLASIWYSQTAWSFGGFGNFENLMQSIECTRKPGTDYMACKPKTEPVEEPEPEPDPEPQTREVSWDLYNRTEIKLELEVDMPGCDNPTKEYTDVALDVDLDGDLDLIYGFKCFSMNEETITQAQEKGYLKHDPYWGWNAESYLAVFINDNGEFRNDQSIFDGEYPVYDRLLKMFGSKDPQDINSDGYPDVIFHGWWDNSDWHIITNKWLQTEPPAGQHTNNYTLMLSDGSGGYKVHNLPAVPGNAAPLVMTDELGVAYLWNVNTEMAISKEESEMLSQSTVPVDIRPGVYRIQGADLIDVTSDYLEFENVSETWPDHYVAECWLHKSQKPYVTHDRQPACKVEANHVYMSKDQENHGGKVYVNTDRNFNLNTYGPEHPIWNHCNGLGQQSHQCRVDAIEGEHDIEVLRVYSMDSKNGLYVSASTTNEVIFKIYLIDPNALPKPDNIIWVSFLDLGGQYQLSPWGWGMAVDSQGDEVIVLNNYGGPTLDPGATPDDFDDFVRYWLDNHHPNNRPSDYVPYPNDGQYGGVVWWATHGSLIYRLIAEGFCPDVLDIVDTQDCMDETWLTQSWVDREIYTGEPGRGMGFRIKGDVIVTEPNLLNQDMAMNPQESHFIDIDSDGDLDLYLDGPSFKCGVQMCLYENTGDFNMKVVDTGVWAQAYDENFQVWAERCQGPQHISEGQWDDQLCDLELSRAWTPEYGFTHTQPSIADLDGDGKFDLFSIQRQTGNLSIMYGE
jgi:hypothetical protein